MLPEQKNEARRNSGVFVFAVETVFRDFLKFVFRLKLIFFGIVLISKMIFKNKKKYYFHAFPSKKHFKIQPLPYSKTLSKLVKLPIVFFLLSYFSLLFSAGIGCPSVLSPQNLSNAFFSEQGYYLHHQ
jgi:uncharacterized membrane protein YfcA